MIVIVALFAAPSPRAQQRSVFRSGTELVLVNVVVRDKTGAVVRNLSRDDFTVTEDDKPQTVTSFDFEELASSPVATDAAASATPAEPILSSPGRAVADDQTAKASAERPSATVDMGADPDLTVATKTAIQEMVDFLAATKKLTKHQAYQVVSLAGNVAVTQLVDKPNVGVHVRMPKSVFK